MREGERLIPVLASLADWWLDSFSFSLPSAAHCFWPGAACVDTQYHFFGSG